ncbi:MAG: DNA-directed RNA polymerase subunit omega [Campylobacteraceae bacterium]|nr:DNA-directed RNA polymerase subunit omega [Campylobacteraceae bacterium]
MRIEKIIAKAMDQMDGDRYKLSLAVSKRAEALALGAIPLVTVDKSKTKLSDIALMEIAAGKIGISTISLKEE